MKLFLLRHAPAEQGSPDPERPLSPAGHRRARELAAFLHGKRYFRIKNAWCSPYLRARQSLQPLLDAGLIPPGSVHYRDDLRPHSDFVPLLPAINRHRGPLLLVGHNPHLAGLARCLAGIDYSTTPLPFKKGALFVFKRERAAATGFILSAVLPPAALGLT